MAGVATAYSSEALPSTGGVDNEKWEFSVPIGSDVGAHSKKTLFCFPLLSPSLPLPPDQICWHGRTQGKS